MFEQHILRGHGPRRHGSERILGCHIIGPDVLRHEEVKGISPPK